MFERPVLFDGNIFRFHEIVAMTNEFRNGRTIVEVHSRMSEDPEPSTTHWLTLDSEDQTTLVAELEETAKADPAFAEHEDPVAQSLSEVLTILTDEQAEAIVDAFPAWAVGRAYAVGDRVRYEGALYKVIQAHTSQADWTPDVAVSLFVRLSPEEGDDDPTTIPEWVQPTGAQDAYNTGDRVRYEGSVYESTIDGNVWSPADYPQGWRLVE